MTLDELTFGGEFRIAQLRFITEEGYFRRSLSPGDDLSGLPKDVQKQIEAEWTSEVIAAFIAETTKEEPEPESYVDPRDAEIADLKAAVSALKKSGVLTDAMHDAERAVKSDPGKRFP